MSVDYVLLKKISYRFNVIVIEFTEDMDREDKYSYKNVENYGFSPNNSIIPFPTETQVITEVKGPSVRLTLPHSYNIYIVPNEAVHLGYVYKKSIKYIKSRYGNVHNICDVPILGAMVGGLNIENGLANAISYDTVEYNYQGDNDFYKFDIKDFYAEINGMVVKPIEAQIHGSKIIFKFPQDTFKNYNGNGDLKTISNPNTVDIYGFPIEPNKSLHILDKVPRKISTLSLVNILGNKVYLKLLFEKPLIDFYQGDFLALFNGKLYNIDFEDINGSRDVVKVSAFMINGINMPIKIFTAVNYDLVRTIDVNLQKVFDPNGVYSEKFVATTPYWYAGSNSLANNIIDIYYENDVYPESLIIDKNFNGSYIPWDGKDLIIPIGALKINHGAVYDELSLNNNPNFGIVKIYSKQGFNFINNNITNDAQCLLHKDKEKVSIIFSNYERAIAFTSAIDSFYYSPSEFIESKNNYFIFYGYEPKGKKTQNDTLYIPPLQDSLDNPFTGGMSTFNYVLQVDNGHTYRRYGVEGQNTWIQGYVRVVGNLDMGQRAYLVNLNILGGIIVEIENGSITIKDVKSPQLIYF